MFYSIFLHLRLYLKLAVQCLRVVVGLLTKFLQRSAVACRTCAVLCNHSSGKVSPRQLLSLHYRMYFFHFVVQVKVHKNLHSKLPKHSCFFKDRLNGRWNLFSKSLRLLLNFLLVQNAKGTALRNLCSYG